ncbi:MAG: hypothetical protein ACI9Y1_002124 [Lentisphaeria bacterium]|jgi:hypothetical protein
MSQYKPTIFEDLDIKMGQVVQIMPKHSSEKAFFDVVLVGAIPGESLIMTTSDSGVFPAISAGDAVIFRVMLSDALAVFSCVVLFISEVPMFMVYVDYPKDIKLKQVRKASRVNVSLPVLASNTTTGKQIGVAGRISDISTAGAGVELFEPLGSVNDEVVLKGKFIVGSIRRLLAIKGVIRMEKKKSDKCYVYGVEFREGAEEDLLVLFGFIFNAMTFGKIQKIR